ncbi:MAG: glycosyltransferase [Firmicutes bacterium]|nr:glycosyltransferase [Bacillota bacterium]
MTLSQAVYIAAVAFYLAFFILFARFFFWKWYADSLYWKRKPQLTIPALMAMAARRGLDLPFFSVMVPARNEAEVIGKTIDHMSRMNYPADRYEIIVVTDEKETMARAAEKDSVVEAAADCVRGAGGRLKPQSRMVLIGLITRLSFKEFHRSEWLTEEVLSSKPLADLPPARQQALVSELANEIVTGWGRPPTDAMELIVRREIPGMTDEEAARVYPLCLSLAMPIVATYCALRGDASGRIVDRMIRYAARASHTVTREILRTLTESISGVIVQQVRSLRTRNRLIPLLAELHDVCLPTTQDIVEAKIREFKANGCLPTLKHVTVPYDFDGRFPGNGTGTLVPSTKGRALNYGLSFLDPRSEMCGFYDAESRPDPSVLMYVAYRRLESGDLVKILQGPVFQVRNFYQMGPFCKIASLYQAIAHDWYLPALFRRLPFVGGTNLFLDRELMRRIGGFDHNALTEDLEIGTRAYLECGAWPEYLPYYSTEQTPPSLQAFFRQRLRWGTGHLQVMDKIRNDCRYPEFKKRPLLRQLFVKGQVEWVLYQGATLVPPVVITLWYNGLVDPYILPDWTRWVLNLFSLVYFAFTAYAYYRYMPYLDSLARPKGILRRALVVAELSFLPLAAFFFPVPYSSALILKRFNRHPRTWAKTPRTRE